MITIIVMIIIIYILNINSQSAASTVTPITHSCVRVQMAHARTHTRTLWFAWLVRSRQRKW